METKGQQREVWESSEADTVEDSEYAVFFSSGMRLLHRTICGLLPSFLQRRTHPCHSKPQRLHPTSYLDGLRGVSSFIVFLGHYTEENLGWYTEPYGAYEDGATSSPLQLPFLRVLYSARPMVHIFLIISGYVLSYKPLKQIHSQQYAAFANTISSSIFRRALRLFLPSFVALLIMAIALFSGLSTDRYAQRQIDLASQLQHVWETCVRLLRASWAVNDLAYPQPQYNPALWTIPVEFAQSLLLFVTLLGLSRCRSNVRLTLLAGIILFCFYSGQLYTVEFLGGMFIAEVTLLRDRSLSSPTLSPMLPSFDGKYSNTDYGSEVKQKLIQAFWLANAISGLFIASWTNNHIDEVWGLRFLDAHTPEPYQGQKVWFCLGAFQIVAACTQLRCLQRIFTTPVAQYLGTISYALYLMHNLCLTILEPIFDPIFNTFFGKATFWGRQLYWLAGIVVYVPIVIWVADVFWRAVDTQTVRFARWLESKCVVEKKL
ncbi:related to hard surface induced protein 3 (sterol glycosyl transferase) [Rhynchosporium agropyri]|uniref:Related to hard surface induced protein 3 (Sterol glycosyl transferase) n=1 Tax=Rhynchosporium agropyri TaxID=914238 RepID=A0A1E1K1G6_9HELO|nr:related to hard surface induced protein 3 (sterol glycosyl transferase) [Rhynchosporium agropyri]